MLNQEITSKIAELAHIKLDDDDLDRFQGQLASILDYVDKLQEVDTAGAMPMMHAGNLKNTGRQDVVEPQLPSVVEALVGAFPDKKENLLKVKAVFE